MIFHGIWDFTLFLAQYISSPGQENAETTVPAAISFDPVVSLSMAAPALLYAAFVYWRYSKSQHASEVNK